MTNLESTTSEVQYCAIMHRFSLSEDTSVSLKVSPFQTKLSCWLSWRLKLAQKEKYFTLLLSQLHGSIAFDLFHTEASTSVFHLYEKPGFGSVHFRRKGTQQRSSSNAAEPQESWNDHSLTNKISIANITSTIQALLPVGTDAAVLSLAPS